MQHSQNTLPEKHFYQIESRQMIEAHGGYVQITEKKDLVTCLYILPVEGTKVIHFKTYNPDDLAANKVAETTESLEQEEELMKLIESAIPKETTKQLIQFIKHAHGVGKRKSGLPYYTHPMEVTKILLEVTHDPTTLMAALLHDIVEDTPITLNQLEIIYGHEVAHIVDTLTHYNTNGYPWRLDEQEKKKVLEQCDDK